METTPPDGVWLQLWPANKNFFFFFKTVIHAVLSVSNRGNVFVGVQLHTLGEHSAGKHFNNNN